MSINEYNRISELFLVKNMKCDYIKLNDFINFDGYLRREFIHPRKVRIENGNIYFTVEHYTEFRDYEVCVSYKDIKVFVPVDCDIPKEEVKNYSLFENYD